MTRDDVIRMAREAGIDAWWDSGNECREDLQVHLEHFSGLIAAATREEFLNWCEASSEGITPRTDWTEGYVTALKNVAQGFRARGNQ